MRKGIIKVHPEWNISMSAKGSSSLFLLNTKNMNLLAGGKTLGISKVIKVHSLANMTVCIEPIQHLTVTQNFDVPVVAAGAGMEICVQGKVFSIYQTVPGSLTDLHK